MPKQSNAREMGHLLRRAGFGPSEELLGQYGRLDYEAAVDRLVAGTSSPVPAEPAGWSPYRPGAINLRWLELMQTSPTPLAEKLTLFWHGHFATSIQKVEDPVLMWQQRQTFRRLGGGRFSDLVSAVSRDPAMIRWLDGNSNRKGAPNENYARELMELFTIGRGNYTEKDVREAARAFTGWGASRDRFHFQQRFHDDGIKRVLGTTGSLDGDDVARIVTSHPACAPFICRKLLVFFSHPDPTPAEVADAAKVFTRTKGEIAAVLRHILTAPAFRSERARRSLVKSPAEFVVGSALALGIPKIPLWAVDSMRRMGQQLFAPPTVKGWDGGRAWLSAGALLERIRFASRLTTEVGRVRDADATLTVAFDGPPPSDVAEQIGAITGANRIALAFASPEFQLS